MRREPALRRKLSINEMELLNYLISKLSEKKFGRHLTGLMKHFDRYIEPKEMGKKPSSNSRKNKRVCKKGNTVIESTCFNNARCFHRNNVTTDH